MASKISTELTPEQVVELLETLVKTPGGKVLRVIQAEAKKRGVEVSLMGASSFRDEELAPFLQKLKNYKAKSEFLATAITAGDETGLLAGNRLMLAEKISDFLMSEEVAPKQFTSLAASLQMLTTSNQGEKKTAMQLRTAEARLRDYEAKEEERKREAAKLIERKQALAKKKGISKEAIELMEETFQLLG